MRTRVGNLALGTALVVGVALAPAAPAAAAMEVACGMSVEADLTLTHDLVCTGDGLVVVNDGVTIDLGGHTIRHVGDVVGRGISGLYTNTRVLNGRISGFRVGIDMVSGSLSLNRVTLSGNRTGTNVYGGSVTATHTTWRNNGDGAGGNYVGGMALTDVLFTGNDAGVSIDKASGVTLTRATVTGNTTGVFAYSGEVTLTDSTITRNGTGVIDNAGLFSSDRLTLVRTRVSRNRVGVSASVPVTLSGSRVVRNRIGVLHKVEPSFDTGAMLTISRSSVIRNRVGVRLAQLSGLAMSRSTFRRNGVGVVATDTPRSFRVTHSAFTLNKTAGIYLDTGASLDARSAVAANRFTLNGRRPRAVPPVPSNDGLFARVGEGTLRVRDNVARRNAGQGIEAYGVVDGGGNVASGNRGRPQCIGVVCH